ncbi:MAG: transglycosylase SLT domain-containing protein [Rectinemataceae bacterium]
MLPNIKKVAHRVLSLIALCLAVISCGPSAGFDPSIDGEVLKLATVGDKDLPERIDALGHKDAIAEYYSDPVSRRSVVDFFASVTTSENTAVAILDNAVRHKVPASLAFAIAYEESKFDPKAVGKNEDSFDRGLFQLNSKSFPELKEQEAFDPNLNAKAGLGYFKNILESAGNEVTALAMYNAGRTRVSKGATPKVTLDYISRVLNYEENITSMFTARVIAKASLLEKVRFGLISGTASSRVR